MRRSPEREGSGSAGLLDLIIFLGREAPRVVRTTNGCRASVRSPFGLRFTGGATADANNTHRGITNDDR